MDLFLVAVFLIGAAQVHAQNWGYSTREQRRWSADFRQCHGNHQSPINIVTEKTIPIYIKPLKLFAYDRLMATPLLLRNTGKTASLTLTPESKGFIPHISGGNLNDIYIFESIHFHWGKLCCPRSEHRINGLPFAFELHIIHNNIKYSEADALNHPDGLVVFSILFETSLKENHGLTPIIDQLYMIRNYNASTTIWKPLTLKSLISNLDVGRYYTYQGSLTTPPCSESVTWFVFEQVLKISHSQLEDFHYLLNENGQQIDQNIRQLQPINDRHVYARKNSAWFRKTKGPRLDSLSNEISHH